MTTATASQQSSRGLLGLQPRYPYRKARNPRKKGVERLQNALLGVIISLPAPATSTSGSVASTLSKKPIRIGHVRAVALYEEVGFVHEGRTRVCAWFNGR